MFDRTISKTEYVLLAFIVVLAAILRVIGLDAPLWYDEILTLTLFVRESYFELLTQFSFNNHVFYSLQAKLAIAAFGESATALRMPALIYGLLSIVVFWRLARAITSRFPALITALLIAVSYHHVWFSQNARGYTALMFWFGLSTLFLMAGCKRPGTKIWLLYALSATAGAYTHLTAVTYVLSHAIIIGFILIISSWRTHVSSSTYDVPNLRWRHAFIGFGLSGVLTLLLYAPMLGTVINDVASVSGTSAVDVMVEYQNPLWTLMEMIRSVASPDLPVLLVVLLTCTLVLTGLLVGRAHESIPAWALAIHVPLLLLIVLALSTRIWPRFFFQDMGLILLFLTIGVYTWCGFTASVLQRFGVGLTRAQLFGSAALAMIVISCLLLNRNYQFPKQNFSGALNYVESNRKSSDQVGSLGLASVAFAGDYFDTDWLPVESLSDLNSLVEGSGSTWLVMAFPARSMRKYTAIMTLLSSQFELIHELPGTLGDGRILIYREVHE